MLRFLLYLLLFYIIYSLVRNILLTPKSDKKKVKHEQKKNSSFDIDKNNIEDANFKEIE